MKHTIALLLAILLSLSGLFACGDPTPAATTDTSSTAGSADPLENKIGLIDICATLNEKSVPLHRASTTESIDLAFLEGANDVPLISVERMVELLSTYVRDNRDEAYRLEYKLEDGKVLLTRDNGAFCKIDPAEGTVFFDDYNRFNKLSFEIGSLDILDSDCFSDLGEPEYFQRVMCSEKAGEASLVELHKRGIPTVLRDGKAYLTLQAFNDLFLIPYEATMLFNGNECFLTKEALSEDLELKYYSAELAPRSAALIDITYKHLCLLIDFHYGLQESHGISSADAYLAQIGLKSGLNSEDPATFFSAIKTLTYAYLADNHTSVMMHSPYHADPNYSSSSTEASIGYWEFYKSYLHYTALRKEQFDGGQAPYSEIGDTAFIVFDTFSSATVNYYENSPVNGVFNDEIGLISYAHAMITRENSPIKNVVIDLATNTGGHMDGGIYLAAWVLGNAVMHISDPIRNAEASFVYRADVNLDRVFDEKDTISDKNVYLITSPITFSCANFIASAFKESGKVTLLGYTTGGGACCVYMSSTADGGAITLSSSLCMSTYKNGSYYIVDAGIAPDVKITDDSYIFDYDKLAQLVNSLQ